MHLHEFSGKNICLLGFGREGQATLKAIIEQGIDATITIADRSPNLSSKLQASSYKLRTGEHYLDRLEDFDVIIISPGVPPHPKIDAVQEKVTNATQIFLDTVAGTGAIVIGVTGSKGKSTTASLLHAMLTEAGRKSFLVGNIGEPALLHLKDANENTFFVQEMSSYQLLHMKTSPHIAIITSFFPEHLDYHGSLDAYREAKTNITRFQAGGDIVMYNAEDDGARIIAEAGKGEKVAVSSSSPVRIGETHIIGAHNETNIALAAAAARMLGADEEAVTRAAKSFPGLPHRLQSLGEHHGIRWINDSISTTPESAIAALEATGNDVRTIILGGQDRGNDFSHLAKRIATSGVQTVILLGESGTRIAAALQEAGYAGAIHTAASMKNAVESAKNDTSKGMTCLLSPASPSYDMYKNFEERGEEFGKWIVSGEWVVGSEE